jgi:hypothetical protein
MDRLATRTRSRGQLGGQLEHPLVGLDVDHSRAERRSPACTARGALLTDARPVIKVDLCCGGRGRAEISRWTRLSQSAIDRARAERWAGLPKDERRRRQSQSDGDRAAARAAEVAELENDETLQAMWNTVETVRGRDLGGAARAPPARWACSTRACSTASGYAWVFSYAAKNANRIRPGPVGS